jgi:RNA polymerase-binding transcription factor DksA
MSASDSPNNPSETEQILGRTWEKAAQGPDTSGVRREWRGFQKQLIELQDYIIDETQAMKERGQQTQPKDRQQADAEAATTVQLRDEGWTRLSTYQDWLVEVQQALSRIEQGTYGVCESTGKPIPPERLRAQPWARFTREAEEQLEAQGQASVHFEMPPAGRLKGESGEVAAE